jgi:hypothetical protein
MKANLPHKNGKSFAHGHYTSLKLGYIIHTSPMCESCTSLLKPYNNYESKNPQFYKKHFMGDLLYTIVVILIIGWLIGFFGFHVGGLIHVLLVIAVIVLLVRLIQGRRVL